MLSTSRTFLLSPANVNGRRGAMLRKYAARARAGESVGSASRGADRLPAASTTAAALADAAAVPARASALPNLYDLAAGLADGGAPLGDLFAFISGLYFRGKLTYARAFTASAFIITPSRGLLPPDTRVTMEIFEEFAGEDVSVDNPRYRAPLERDLAALACASPCEMVLFGSIATGKYVDVLLPHLGERLLFPETFIGRGDMSRGGVMLRAAADREELTYIPLAGAIRRGARPPKLERRPAPTAVAPPLAPRN